MKNLILILILSAATLHSTYASNDSTNRKQPEIKWYQRSYIPVHFAGNIGLVSAGFGIRSRNEIFQSALLYGYVPKSVSDVTVHTLTARTAIQLYRFGITNSSVVIPYAALSISLEAGGRSFFFLPDEMPSGYYNFPKSIHLIPAIGVKNRVERSTSSRLRGYELFVEVVSADAYLWYKSISREVTFASILSCSFGMNLLLQ